MACAWCWRRRFIFSASLSAFDNIYAIWIGYTHMNLSSVQRLSTLYVGTGLGSHVCIRFILVDIAASARRVIMYTVRGHDKKAFLR